jgi:membrane protease subunit HflC
MDLSRKAAQILSSAMSWFENPRNVDRFVKRVVTVAVFLAFFSFILFNAMFVVDETQQVVVTQFGKPVRVIKESGLKLKIPIIQSVNVYEKRALIYDADPTKVVTKDKKNLDIDNYAVWKIEDPLKFLETVQTEMSFLGKLNDIIYAQLRQELGQHDLIDIVVHKRDELMDSVTRQADKAVREYGIRILDVRIKRADLPKETKEHIYARMTAEREKMAKKYRSEGQEIATQMRAETDKEREIILAEAYKEAEQIKGEGDAVATRIYAEAFGRDKEFYDFIRSLDAYQKALGDDTLIILSSDNEFLKHFIKKGE